MATDQQKLLAGLSALVRRALDAEDGRDDPRAERRWKSRLTLAEKLIGMGDDLQAAGCPIAALEARAAAGMLSNMERDNRLTWRIMVVMAGMLRKAKP